MKLETNFFLGDEEIALATKYAIHGEKGVSKEVLPWIRAFLNDKNSSTLREAITASVCGYKWSRAKRDYDAFGDTPKELKPRTFNGDKSSLSAGAGNFSDLRPEKVEKLLNDSVGMVVSLFAYTRLVYILEFPFEVIHQRILEQVERDMSRGNRYSRCSSFCYKHYINSDKLVCHYMNSDILIKSNCTNKAFRKALVERGFLEID